MKIKHKYGRPKIKNTLLGKINATGINLTKLKFSTSVNKANKILEKSEKEFSNYMQGKSKPSFFKNKNLGETRSLIYNVGKPLKDKGKIKELKKFKKDMLGLTSISYLNKHL